MVKYAVSAPQADLLREIAAISDAVRIPPGRTQVAWALEQRGLIKRTWRGSGHVAVVTADGRYYLKHGKHPRQVQAEKERLAGDSAQAALAPAGGAELLSRLQSTSGTITVADPAPRTRGRWRAAYYDALHHGHVPEGHKVRWNGRQRGDCVFTLVNEEAEKAAQPPPVPSIDVPEVLDRPHPLVRATRKAMGRSQGTVDTRGRAEAIPLHVSRPLADRALRIMHALLTEAENRGHTAEPQTDLQRGEALHTLAIVIRGRAFPLALTERTTKVLTSRLRRRYVKRSAIPGSGSPGTTRSSTDASPSVHPPRAGTSTRMRTATGCAGRWSHAWDSSYRTSNISLLKANAGTGSRNGSKPSGGAGGTRLSHRRVSSRSISSVRRCSPNR